MPTLPLYVPPAQRPFADGWHQVAAPGGYEWWYFDAEDPATDTQLVAIFMEGFVFHPGYIRAYARYRRRPTRVPPPLPRDYVCGYFVVYRGGKILHQFITQYPATEFAAATDRLDVRIGPNRCRVDDDGTIRLTMRGTPWVLTGRGPQTLIERTLSAELVFKPKMSQAPMERTFLSREMTGADHHWVLAHPLCDVSGSVQVTGGGAAAERIDITGRGYHDHNYGSGPIGPGVDRWVWGRVLLDGRMVAFHRALPRWGVNRPAETHLVDSTASNLVEDATWVTINWNGRTRLGLRYPLHVQVGDVLRLEQPRVVDSAPFYLRLQYAAEVAGARSTAFCEVAYPHRLRWPVLGRMIEMSIDKRPCQGGGGAGGAA